MDIKPGDVPIVTQDSEMPKSVHPTDAAIIQACSTGEGLVEMSMDELVDLARAADETHNAFMEIAARIMTEYRAKQIRKWRVGEGMSWRGVAEEAYNVWAVKGTEDEWGPPSNQLMGMALCECAAETFGEHYMQDPWN